MKLQPEIFLAPEKKIAFVMSPRLGDSLLSMVVVHNLLENGLAVDVFGNYLYALRRWFSIKTIYPFPPAAECQEVLARYDVVLHAYHKDVLANANPWHPGAIIFDELSTYRQRILMPDIQVAVCRENLKLPYAHRWNGLRAPAGLIHRRCPQRVVIHPTSYEEHKNWLPSKFLQLAQQLRKNGYQPEFIVSPVERPAWEWLAAEGFSLPQFSSLDEVACWIYESGWMIGNDSGIGHLASNCGIPTLTIGMRTRAMRRWRPSWTRGKVVLPPPWLKTKLLRERFWKQLVTVEQVAQAFEQLVAEGAETENKGAKLIHHKSFNHYWICQQHYYTAAMQDFLRAPDTWLRRSKKFFKNTPGDTSTVAVVTLDGIDFVVKRYNIKNFWHGMKLLFRPSRAMTSWRNAQRLSALNIPTVEPVAVLEKRLGPLRRQAYFVSCYVNGISGDAYFAQPQQLPETYVAAITAIVAILRQLKTARIYHNDFHHSNFLMVENQPLLIDLDHMQQCRYHNKRFLKAHQKDIAKFRHYLQHNVMARDLFDQILGSDLIG